MSITGTVRELYIPLADYPHVKSDATLRDVFAVLHASCSSAELFKSILVVDERDRLVGMLGLKNLLHALLPDYLRSSVKFQGAGDDLSALAALWQDDCVEAFHSAHKIFVRDHVVPLPNTIQADDPLVKAVFIFATAAVNLLPVTDGQRVIGVLRLVAIIDEVTSEILSEQVVKA
ncbi:MAG: CBS domain-containing protein [Rhodocyclaceae bacterium]|nr:CBS domain-containing protein [Rhodocyclaceae bacterium]MDP1956904.1 CBS domain-containing protein [Rhodocyclaceae bacterium]